MRKWNFCAGPAAIPEEVLIEAQNELLEWGLSGSSVMEVSHRSDLFAEVATSSTTDIKALLNIGDDHEVLFLQGGATLQFTSVPLNFTKNSSIVSYLNTGLWSKKLLRQPQNMPQLMLLHLQRSQTIHMSLALKNGE